MAGAESCLQSVEPREEDILRLEAEVQEYRPVLDNLNQIGPQLCQVIYTVFIEEVHKTDLLPFCQNKQIE